MTTAPDDRPPIGPVEHVDGRSREARSWLVVAANFAWLNAERALDVAITLLVTVLVARYLGPDRFGILGYLTGLAALLSSVVPLGMGRVLVFELVNKPQNENRLLGTSTALKLCSASIIGLAMAVAVPLLDPDLEHALLFGCLFAGSIVAGAFDGPELLFTARTQARYTVFSAGAARIAMAAVRLALIYAAASLTAFVSATVIESVLTIVFLLLIYRLQAGNFARWRFDRDLALHLMRRGVPLMLASLSTALMMRLGIVMVERLAGDAAAGFYTSAARLADACGLLANNFLISIGPTLISMRSQSRDRYADAIARVTQGVSAGMTLAALAIFLLSGPLIRFLLGPAFSEAADVLRVYIWSSVFIALGLVETQWLINEGYDRFILARSVAGAVTSVIATLVLVPRYGGVGAAYAAVIAQATSCVLMNLVWDTRTRQMFLLQVRSLAWLELPLLLARRRPESELRD